MSQKGSRSYMMNTAIINELSEIIHSDDDKESKLLKIEVLVGLAEKLQQPTQQPTQPVQPAPQRQAAPGPIVGVESI